ncbi:MAG: hypothetical protein AAF360_12980, partial [Pseudomonadota bacterium]
MTSEPMATDDMTTDERALLAAEYVLGLLSSEQEGAAGRAFDQDAPFRSLVLAWEARLARVAPPGAAPEDMAGAAGNGETPAAGLDALWSRIETKLDETAAAEGTRTVMNAD